MFNEYVILQLSIISIIFFIYWVVDVFNLIILGVLYLFLISFLSFFLDFDILVSFLIIIDLGVFLIFFSFLLHLVKFLTNKNIYDTSFKNLFILTITISYLFLYNYFINFYFIWNYNKIMEYTWIYFISYLDFYNLWNVILNSDMHLLKELYFHINSLEFILVSIFLVIGILNLYVLLNILVIYEWKSFNKINFNLKNKNNSVLFFKIQNYTNQVNTSASSRVWSKNKYDFKTNNYISNR